MIYNDIFSRLPIFKIKNKTLPYPFDFSFIQPGSRLSFSPRKYQFCRIGFQIQVCMFVSLSGHSKPCLRPDRNRDFGRQAKPTIMTSTIKTTITVETTVNAPVEKVWTCWTKPEHITKWNNASDDWHSPSATNDLRNGGHFSYRMEAKDGSFGFDFGGTYDEVKTNELITYTLGDGRKVKIIFTGIGDTTKLTEAFEAETENPIELQRGGWKAILDNFKKYVESN